MNLNINGLKYFVDTASKGSTLKAAQINFVSQPAISQGIKKLEEQMGINLLNHKRNSIELTNEGENVLKHSEQIFSAIENFKNTIDKIKSNKSGSIKVAVSSSIAEGFLISQMANYTKKYPDVDISIKVGKTELQRRFVSNNDTHFGITIDNENLSDYTTHSIFTGNFVLAGKKGCPEKLIVTEDRPEVQKLLSSLKKMNSPLLENRVEIESWGLILKFIENGFGHGFLPDFLISSNKKNMQFLKIPQIKYKVTLFHRSDVALPFHASQLLDSLKKN